MAIDKVVSASITDSAVTDAKLSFNSNQFRNIIINGDMSFAQRGTSQASITSSNYYTIDRIRTSINNGGTWTQSQSTEVPTGQGFATSLKMDCTTADTSLSSGDFLHVQIPIEAQDLQYLKYGTSSAETLTLSFWVKSNKTGTYCICLQKSDNTRYDFVAEYSISSADTWEKKTITIAPDSNIQAAGGAIDNNNGEGFKLKFTLLSSGRTGTNNTWNSSTPADCTSNQVNLADSTSNEWYVTGVQLETGTSASDFEFLPVDVNEKRCFRYFQTYTVMGTMGARNSTDVEGSFEFHTPMRAAPSASQKTAKVFRDMFAGTFTQSSAAIGIVDSSDKGLFVGMGNLSGLTQGRIMCATSGTSEFSSEL
jgi:hypothetical protein